MYRPQISAVIPVRDRPEQLARLLAALDADEVIVVDDASREPVVAPGARVIRHATRRGAAAARNTGLAAARHELVALLDSDTAPQPGWLEPLLPYFEDPEVQGVAPRIVALRGAARPGEARRAGGAARADAGAARPGEGDGEARRAGGAARPEAGGRPLARWAEWALARYEARHSPLDRGPAPARVRPRGRVPFVPGAALVVRRHLRFDETLNGGEDVDMCWRTSYIRYEPSSRVAHDHRTTPGAWFARRVHYGRTAAPLDKRHPGNAPPLTVDPWTAAAYAALALRRPRLALAITATAVVLLAREAGARNAVEIAGLGTLRSYRAVASAVRRAWWPVMPRRVVIAALLADPHPIRIIDDFAYSLGVLIGCLEHRTAGPLKPARWRRESLLGSEA